MKEIVIKLTAKKLRGSLDFARTQILRCFADVSALTCPFVESYTLLHKYKEKWEVNLPLQSLPKPNKLVITTINNKNDLLDLFILGTLIYSSRHLLDFPHITDLPEPQYPMQEVLPSNEQSIARRGCFFPLPFQWFHKHYSPVLFKKSPADIPLMEAYGQRLSIKILLACRIPNGVTIYRSIDTPPPQNKLKQFYL